MPFGPHPCDDPNHGKTVGPVDMALLLKHLCSTDTCPSLDGYNVMEATMLGSHDIGFAGVFELISMQCWKREVWEEALSVPGGAQGARGGGGKSVNSASICAPNSARAQTRPTNT
jgi:hypothetical protein